MARSFCALALLCAYLAHRRSTLETRSRLRHWLLERRCGIILLQYTADAGFFSYSGSTARALSTREETDFSLTFSVALSTPSKRPALRRCISLSPSATVFCCDSLTHLTYVYPAARFMGYVHYLQYVCALPI